MAKTHEYVSSPLPDYLRVGKIIKGGKEIGQIFARTFTEPGHEETWYLVTLDDGELIIDGLGRTIGQALSSDVLNIARAVIGLGPIALDEWKKIREANQRRGTYTHQK